MSTEPETAKPSRWRPSAVVIGALLAAGAAALWLTGRVASDRWPPLQQISWIPVPLLLAVLGLATLLVGWGRRWRLGVLGWVLLIGWMVLGADHLARRWRPASEPAGGVRIVHWNAASPSESEAAGYAAALAKLDAEIIIVSNDWWLFGRPFTRNWEAQDRRVVRAGPFALVTDLPVVEARLVIANSGMWVGQFQIEGLGPDGGPLVILAVDLPSAPELARWTLASDLRERLDGLGLPSADLVVGDFNLDAGSVALRRAFPGMQSAFARAGRGYAGSYPREWPLWQPDQALVGDGVGVLDYRLLDLGVGSHRAQAMVIEAPEPERSR